MLKHSNTHTLTNTSLNTQTIHTHTHKNTHSHPLTHSPPTHTHTHKHTHPRSTRTSQDVLHTQLRSKAWWQPSMQAVSSARPLTHEPGRKYEGGAGKKDMTTHQPTVWPALHHTTKRFDLVLQVLWGQADSPNQTPDLFYSYPKEATYHNYFNKIDPFFPCVIILMLWCACFHFVN